MVDDATCATTVCRVFNSLVSTDDYRDGKVLLNYTGGTKVMAAHTLRAFLSCDGKPEHASYLDEGGPRRPPRLRFDDGNSTPLSDFPLTLATVLALHGITHKPREAKPPAPTIDDAREILCKVLADVPLANALSCEHKRLEELRKPDKATSAPFRDDRYRLTLSLPEFPTDQQLNSLANSKEKESWFKQWYKFIGGGWLEEWVGEQIRTFALDQSPEITVGVNAFRGEKKAQLEVDVAVIRGHRSYFVSCTTDTSKPICKSKLFEVAVRSRQLGGDLARAALVCLADDNTVGTLQQDIEDLWGASNTPQVFGLSDIRTWSNCGKSSNLHSLKTWLEG